MDCNFFAVDPAPLSFAVQFDVEFGNLVTGDDAVWCLASNQALVRSVRGAGTSTALFRAGSMRSGWTVPTDDACRQDQA